MKRSDNQHRETKETILKVVYPCASEGDYKKLFKAIQSKQLEIENQNVVDFNNLGFPPFQYQDSEVQRIIR